MDAPTPQMIAVNGTELAQLEQGDGPPLIFVHGSLGDYRAWRDQLPAFAGRYRAMTYSRRAHFPNPWPADYTQSDPEVHAADLAALIEALESGPVHLFGHSYGGLIALVTACRRPELVRTLTLGEPPLLPWLEATAEGRAIAAGFDASAWQPARRAFARGEMEAGVRLFIDGVVGVGAYDQMPPPVQAAMLVNARAKAVKTVSPPGTLFSALTRDEVARLPMPVLLLGGEQSPRMFSLIIDELAACLPDAERATIPGVSHHLHNPPFFQETLLGFLARH